MNIELMEALKQIQRERGVDPTTILESLAQALANAYKRNNPDALNPEVVIDPGAGKIQVFAEEEHDGKTERIEVTPKDFGRLAAQTAKQVIHQKIRDVERQTLLSEYSDRIGDIATGIVEQSDHRYTLISLGRVEALLPQGEQVPGERYEHGSRVKAYILEVRETSKGPQVIVSRTHPGLVKRLFELEVPEIYDGYVEIKSVAREGGHRAKIAVWSKSPQIDPVGACVGPKGSRVRMVVNELRGEKIDIVPFNEDPKVFVANAIAPAKTRSVNIDEDNHKALVIVPDNQLSLAIGKDGQNARLAAKLTSWKIDIKSETQAREEVETALSGETGGEEEAGAETAAKPAKKATATTSEEAQCAAVTSSGKPCKNKAKPGSKYCGVHAKQEGAE